MYSSSSSLDISCRVFNRGSIAKGSKPHDNRVGLVGKGAMVSERLSCMGIRNMILDERYIDSQ